MIEFHLDARSGVPDLSAARAAGHAGDPARDPAARATSCRRSRRSSASLAINPNTVLKAYRELDLRGPRRGAARVRGRSSPADAAAAAARPTSRRCARRCSAGSTRARAAGLDDDNMAALFADTVRPPAVVEGRHERARARRRRPRQALRLELGAARLHARDRRPARSPRSSARTAPARRRCCSSPSA